MSLMMVDRRDQTNSWELEIPVRDSINDQVRKAADLLNWSDLQATRRGSGQFLDVWYQRMGGSIKGDMGKYVINTQNGEEIYLYLRLISAFNEAVASLDVGGDARAQFVYPEIGARLIKLDGQRVDPWVRVSQAVARDSLWGLLHV